jgi:hypothetical protein
MKWYGWFLGYKHALQSVGAGIQAREILNVQHEFSGGPGKFSAVFVREI